MRNIDNGNGSVDGLLSDMISKGLVTVRYHLRDGGVKDGGVKDGDLLVAKFKAMVRWRDTFVRSVVYTPPWFWWKEWVGVNRN